MEQSAEKQKFPYTWVLWFFDPRNKSWALENYKKVADIQTPQQLWSVMRDIPKEAWQNNYFFFMRHGFRPIWEVPENQNGGSWSKKVSNENIQEIAEELIVHSVTSHLVSTRPETLVGFSTSPKGEFNVVKIWNTTTTLNNKALLDASMEHFKIGDDVTYTPHRARGY
jgi:translation initiation factor 4E